MGNASSEDSKPIFEYCNLCDTIDHSEKECEILKKFHGAYKVVQCFYKMNSTYCCWRIEGKITKRLPLGEDKTSMVFWLENYGDKPFYYFGNNKLDLNDDSSIIVYPINIKHPKEMNYLYVDRIENKKL